MQFKKTAISWLIFIIPALSFAQSTNLPQGYKHAHFLDRLEILLQDNADLNFSALKPLSRKTVVQVAEMADSLDNQYPFDYFYHLSPVDKYNLQDLRMNNMEWASGDKSRFNSKKSVWNTFYKTKGDLFQVNEKDFFMAVNPVIQQQQSIESGNTGQRIFLNSKGLAARGLIANKVGFDFYLTDNQERPPLFVQNYENKFLAVPGAGFYKPFKTTAYDYFDARGSIYFGATKYFKFQFGYDRNFIGNGYRSLLLSDFATSNLFLKINTRIWKLDYTNLFMELAPQNKSNPGNILLPKKYAAMHRLGINVTKWLNIGLFEAVVFGRPNRFDFSYLNPVIFLRSIEQQNGSPDNAMIGLDYKMNIGHQGQLYGQVLIDEFVLSQLRSGNGWWGNKFGIQLGGKMIDLFDIKNLDVQAEVNFLRPFTYSHSDSIANYSHYNQPLAHPLGANLQEGTVILRYQPKPRWSAQLKVILFSQGIDTANSNYGGNIFLINSTRSLGDYGYTIGTGVKANGINSSLWVGYEILENLFIDASVMYRRYNVPSQSNLSRNFAMVTVGLRVNMFRREYDY
jgi:hypothetical protein